MTRNEPENVVDPAVVRSIDRRLTVALQRKRTYLAVGDERSAEIQEDVINRLLRERKEETG